MVSACCLRMWVCKRLGLWYCFWQYTQKPRSPTHDLHSAIARPGIRRRMRGKAANVPAAIEPTVPVGLIEWTVVVVAQSEACMGPGVLSHFVFTSLCRGHGGDDACGPLQSSRMSCSRSATASPRSSAVHAQRLETVRRGLLGTTLARNLCECVGGPRPRPDPIRGRQPHQSPRTGTMGDRRREGVAGHGRTQTRSPLYAPVAPPPR